MSSTRGRKKGHHGHGHGRKKGASLGNSSKTKPFSPKKKSLNLELNAKRTRSMAARRTGAHNTQLRSWLVGRDSNEQDAERWQDFQASILDSSQAETSTLLQIGEDFHRFGGDTLHQEQDHDPDLDGDRSADTASVDSRDSHDSHDRVTDFETILPPTTHGMYACWWMEV